MYLVRLAARLDTALRDAGSTGQSGGQVAIDPHVRHHS